MAVFTVVNNFLGSLATPLYILVLTNILDYLTGIGAAVYRGERVSSETGFHGIAKKVCMWLLVLVGYIVDYIIISMGQTMHIQFSFECLVAAAVVFWLLANELISILENVADIGVPMPAFLLKAVELVKGKAEYTAEIDKGGKIMAHKPVPTPSVDPYSTYSTEICKKFSLRIVCAQKQLRTKL